MKAHLSSPSPMILPTLVRLQQELVDTIKTTQMAVDKAVFEVDSNVS